MGGKKKTKWRKLPLEEFTKDIPTKSDKIAPDDTCQTDSTREENNCIPSYGEPSETAQNYTEPYEYIDGLWYPTSCVVYNPAEVGLYSNYMMPIDTCYYYYGMPEMPQVQEYVPTPYQEYPPALPKDTVYLLLPTQVLRPSQPVQNIVPEWQTRRRRRRYEGYADYAVIPDKPKSSNVEERDRKNVKEQLVNSRKNSAQSNDFGKMSSEVNKFDESTSIYDQYPSCSKSIDVKKSSNMSLDISNVTGPVSANKETDSLNRSNAENNQKSKKNSEMCGIHSKNDKGKWEPQIAIETNLKNESYPTTNAHASNTEKKISDESAGDSSSSYCSNPAKDFPNAQVSFHNKKTHANESRKQSDKICDINLIKEDVSARGIPLFDTDQELKSSNKTIALEPKKSITDGNVICNLADDVHDNDLHCSLPDILSTLNKPQQYDTKQESVDFSESQLRGGMDRDKGLYAKSFSSQTSNLSNLFSSESLHNEMEMELNQLQSLHSLQANQFIYKLAYDENDTYQSEDSRSLSSLDPEMHIPQSKPSTEIIVQEANSDSDGGSEDLEMLPHRYESESSVNENKHLFINKLSLAVELLRTQESIPYDNEFKRVVEDETNILVVKDLKPSVHTGGKINKGFFANTSSNLFSISKYLKSKSASTDINVNGVVQYQRELKHSGNSSNDSAIFSGTEFDSFEEELSEAANEVDERKETQDNSEEVRRTYRRIGIQAHHYLNARTPFSFNPCVCCTIM